MDMQHKFDPLEMFLDASQVAARYGLSESTLANHRVSGTGLPWVKIGGRVLYPASGLLQAERDVRSLTWSSVRKGLAATLQPKDAERAEKAIREAATGGA